jgi:hypothetical protein|tara:strand:+ start:2080 stop:3126 length:1047 start_codon:yes stop_codon:yes gene_type:complete
MVGFDMKFPREVWAGSPVDNAIQPKRIVVNDESYFRQFVLDHNGKMNVYTSVYDYDEFSNNRGLEHTVNIDRIFLDIDAHDGELEQAFEDLKKLHRWLLKEDYKHTMAFSGRGFYIFVYGVRTFDLRRVKAFYNICHDVINKSKTLDSRVINTARLRRVQNTYHMGARKFSINLRSEDLIDLDIILNLSKKPRHMPKVTYGSRKVDWPNVKKMEVAEIEIKSVESPATLPILPCLKSAVMTHNPLHQVRHYLVQWYNEILTDMVIFKENLNCRQDEVGGQALEDIVDIICKEIGDIASNEDVWIDYNAPKTRKAVDYVVKKRYLAPSCQTLINNGYCVGKCWRYSGGD